MTFRQTKWVFLLIAVFLIGNLPRGFLLAENSPPPGGKKPSKVSQNPPDIVQRLTGLIFSGQHSRALEFFKTFKGKKSKGVWQQRLEFLGAFLYMKTGDYEKAVKILKGLEKSYDLLQDDVEFYLAVSLRESGKPKEAIEILKNLKSSAKPPLLTAKIDRELALSYCKAGDRGKAIDMFNGLIQAEGSQAKTYRLKVDRAECLVQLGDTQQAAALLKNLYLDYPEGDLSDAIRNRLERLNPQFQIHPNDYLHRAEVLMAKDRPDLALLDLEAAAKAYGPTPLSLTAQLAEAYFKARKYREAAAALEELRGQTGHFGEDDLEKLAKAYARSDQFDKAIAAYEELTSRNPGKNSQYLYKIAFIYMDKGDYLQAHQRFADLLNTYPTHPQREQIQWYIAWSNYLLGNYEQALVDLEQVSGKLSQRVPYWKARIYEKTGNTKLAHELYEQIAQDNSFSYYGFLSLKRLDGKPSPEVSPKNGWTKEVPHFQIPKPFYLAKESANDKKAISRLKELLLVGLWDDFLGELNQVTSTEGVSADFYELKQKLAYGEAGAAVDDNGLWEQRYPAAYATLVRLFAETRNIPTALVWAVMREESRFRPSVVSPAKAIGLMQIIPPTGFEIARILGRQGFSPEQLYEPVVNIEFGIQYLAMNLQRFNGSLVNTIASYNAGPEAVERWQKARPNREWDEFIEEIPYDETNLYVKKVLKSYYLYNLLYRI